MPVCDVEQQELARPKGLVALKRDGFFATAHYAEEADSDADPLPRQVVAYLDDARGGLDARALGQVEHRNDPPSVESFF